MLTDIPCETNQGPSSTPKQVLNADRVCYSPSSLRDALQSPDYRSRVHFTIRDNHDVTSVSLTFSSEETASLWVRSVRGLVETFSALCMKPASVPNIDDVTSSNAFPAGSCYGDLRVHVFDSGIIIEPLTNLTDHAIVLHACDMDSSSRSPNSPATVPSSPLGGIDGGRYDRSSFPVLSVAKKPIRPDSMPAQNPGDSGTGPIGSIATVDCKALFGFVRLLSGWKAVVVTETSFVGRLQGHDVFKVRSSYALLCTCMVLTLYLF